MPLVMRVLSLCLLLVAVPASLAHAATPAPLIFPPVSTFDSIDGKSALPPSVTPDPSAVLNVEYVAHDSHVMYQVEEYRSYADAERFSAFYRACARCAARYVHRVVAHPVAPGEWLNTVQSGSAADRETEAWVGLTYRNLLLQATADTDSKLDPSLPKGQADAFVVQRALAIAALLLKRAEAYAATATSVPASPTPAAANDPPMYPPITAFAQQGYTSIRASMKDIASWGPRADYRYANLDVDGTGSLYEVITFASDDSATRFNNASFVSPWKKVPAPQSLRLTPDERAWMTVDTKSNQCTYLLSITFRNLVLESMVVRMCYDVTQGIEAQAATDLLSPLLDRARELAPSTPAQRNEAFVALVHQLEGLAAPCTHLTAIAYKEFQGLAANVVAGRGDPRTVESDAGVAIDACDLAEGEFDSRSGYVKFVPALAHLASVQQLVHSDEFAAMSDRKGLAQGISIYAAMLEQPSGPNAGALASSMYKHCTGLVRTIRADDARIAQQIAAIVRAWHIPAP